MKDRIKYVLLHILRYVLCLFNIFPVRANRIVFYSFNGKQYSCNPRQISEYLEEHYPGQFEIIWAFKNPKEKKALLPENVKAIKYRSVSYYYYAKTARVIVQNVQGYGEIKRRKGQDIIQTWHASNGYKQQGRYTGIRRKLELLYHKDYSIVLSGSDSMTQRRVRGTMGFLGNVINGTPRMDIIINRDHPEYRLKVCKFLGTDENVKILLYAPTWRNNRNDNEYGLNYEQVKDALERRFGGQWIIAVRLHPNVYTAPDINLPFVKNATKYPDMQELLYVADALISDYSSCIWDFSFTDRPCFLYCTDMEKYGQDRDFDIPIRQWRFPLATDMAGLLSDINTYDETAFKKAMELHHQEMGSLEDGSATMRICNVIYHLCLEEKQK
ncbi:MAG: CDP-glycerol glycerophosphotransferase family protein [Clostridia bacterium]|nr:CDP-glycerol glycerophosphotransferase family protein [Clostridia bacterium]MBR2175547.1 CDP-glycerol glycerophosphotransferase family protein [Clostridia bacterium]